MIHPERVSVRHGQMPVILVAPHGADEHNTDVVAKQCAEFLDAHAVVNHGFRKSSTVNTRKDLADCYRIDHLKQPVVKDEFLDALIRAKRAVSRSLSRRPGGKPSDRCLIFYIHSFSGVIADDGEMVEAIVGYGAGPNPHQDQYTCDLWRRNLFVKLWRASRHYDVGDIYVGKRGGRYAGRNPNSLNQYFRTPYPETFVQSMQLMLNSKLLTTRSKATIVGLNLAAIIETMVKSDSYEKQPVLKPI